MIAARRALAAAALLVCGGCAADSYGGARLRDLTDIVDVRYGTGLGLGLQLDATMYLGTGLGWSTVDFSRAWFGRHAVDVQGTEFDGFVVGSDLGGGMCMTSPSRGWMDMFGVNVAMLGVRDWTPREGWFDGSDDGAPPGLDTFRIGGTVFLPGVHGGLYLNVGEVFDFVFGLLGFDPAHDDGIAKLP